MVELRSTIEEVRVYRSGAEITRTAELAPGQELPSTVAIVGLPLALEDASVRVRVETRDGALAFLAEDARIALDASLGERSEATPDERAVRSAREQEAQCLANVARVESEQVRIESASIFPRPKPKRGERPAPSPTVARLELGALVREQAVALSEELGVAREALKRATMQRTEAEARFARASSSRDAKPDELRKAVVVTLSRAVGGDDTNDKPDGESAEKIDSRPTRIKLVVTYFVPGARWAPAYTLRVSKRDGAKRDAEISMRAVVCQRTGEDWTGVRLSLSTADATRWSELPELKSLRVGRAQAISHKRGWRPLPPGVESLFEDFDRASLRFRKRSEPSLPSAAPTSVSTRAAAVPQEVAMAGREMPQLAQGYAALSAPMSFGAPGGGAPQASRARASGALAKSLLGAASGDRAEGEAGIVQDVLALGGGLAKEPSGEVTADTRMLGFGNLRMADPGSSKRGTLTILSEREAYLELSFTERSLVHIDIGEALSVATARAREVANAPPPPRHSDPTAVDGFDHAYDSESPADVPSDGVFHSIPILTTHGEARMHHVTVPRESRDVFRYAEIPSSLDAPLLAGPLEVYVGRDYLLSTDLETTPPRGKIKLGLGVDSAIKVARNTDFTEQVTGLIRGSLDLKHKILIELANNKACAVDIEVRERLPSVRDKEEDIKVELVSVNPRWEDYEQDEAKLKGGHVWRVVLEPGKKLTLEANYVVRIAAKNELVGGNRRETP